MSTAYIEFQNAPSTEGDLNSLKFAGYDRVEWFNLKNRTFSRISEEIGFKLMRRLK